MGAVELNGIDRFEWNVNIIESSKKRIQVKFNRIDWTDQTSIEWNRI
jgi:hypothetical protein